MSSIIYYSNFCEHSKKLLQVLSKTQMSKDIHFICIDNRVRENGKIYIQLQNGQKIIMPENVTKVPALMLLNQNYKVLYGEEINQFFKPRQEATVKQVTHNNMEPMSFSLGGGGYGIVSDQYSFLDMDADSLTAKGDGGVRQMHNYVTLEYVDKINAIEEDASNGKNANRLTETEIEKFQREREQDFNSMSQNRPMNGMNR
jgi:hypothetical protein